MSFQPKTSIFAHGECGANQMAQPHKSQSDGTNPSGEQSSIRGDESANRTGSGHVTPPVVDLTDVEGEVSRKHKLTSKVWNHMVKVRKDGLD